MNDLALPAADGLPPPVPPPLPPAWPGQPAPPPTVRHPVEFHGRAGEFFGIWFVNLVLTILTLGIYSAWAKVRTERYFYGNTRIAGTPFEYLAQPLQILKGRLIAYVVVIGLGLSAHFQLWVVYFPLFLALMLLLPWLVYLTLKFRARYSAWRGLRFRFVDGVYEAYVNFMFRPMLQLVTFYLVHPWVRMNQHDYIVQGHRFGGLRFRFQGDLSAYFIPFLISIGIGFGLYVALMLGVAAASVAVAAMGKEAGAGGEPGTGAMIAIFVPIILFYVALLVLPVYVRTKYVNLMWRFSALGAHRFECTLRARDMIWIYLSNGVAIVLTIGLAVPWAMVRLARYRAQHFAFLASGSVDEFVAEAERKEGATGAELLDALDMDLDIGL